MDRGLVSIIDPLPLPKVLAITTNYRNSPSRYTSADLGSWVYTIICGLILYFLILAKYWVDTTIPRRHDTGNPGSARTKKCRT